jgi:hypothetical protein
VRPEAGNPAGSWEPTCKSEERLKGQFEGQEWQGPSPSQILTLLMAHLVPRRTATLVAGTRRERSARAARTCAMETSEFEVRTSRIGKSTALMDSPWVWSGRHREKVPKSPPQVGSIISAAYLPHSGPLNALDVVYPQRCMCWMISPLRGGA